MRCHVSVPECERGPVQVQEERGVMLTEAGHKGGGQGCGQLQVLVRKQKRSNCGVHTGHTEGKQTPVSLHSHHITCTVVISTNKSKIIFQT